MQLTTVLRSALNTDYNSLAYNLRIYSLKELTTYSIARYMGLKNPLLFTVLVGFSRGVTNYGRLKFYTSQWWNEKKLPPDLAIPFFDTPSFIFTYTIGKKMGLNFTQMAISRGITVFSQGLSFGLSGLINYISDKYLFEQTS
jgi:hypothetical protein